MKPECPFPFLKLGLCDLLTVFRVELVVPVRLRRAILQNDVLLVKRIVKNNPSYLRNPDFSDKSNTSLHLAAIKGHIDVVVCLNLNLWYSRN